MDPVRTLAAYLMLTVAAVGSVQQAQATDMPAMYAPIYTVEPARTENPVPPRETAALDPLETATPEATPTPMPGGVTRLLYRRLTGDDVATVQQRLIDLGYLEGEADGIFGKKTYAAVVEFQRAHDLKQDGIVGEDTLTWLFSGEAIARPTATPAPTPDPTPTPTPIPSPTPAPSPTPVPTAQIPNAWMVPAEGECPVTAVEDASVTIDGEPLADIGVYADAAGEVYLPLRAVVHALAYPEYAHENGSSYEFTVMPSQKVIAIGCEADAEGYVLQPMLMIDGYLSVPETPYRLVRWGEEIYMPAAMWNEIVGEPLAEVVALHTATAAEADE